MLSDLEPPVSSSVQVNSSNCSLGPKNVLSELLAGPVHFLTRCDSDDLENFSESESLSCGLSTVSASSVSVENYEEIQETILKQFTRQSIRIRAKRLGSIIEEDSVFLQPLKQVQSFNNRAISIVQSRVHGLLYSRRE